MGDEVRRSVSGRALEMVLFVLVFGAGTALTVLAATAGPEDATERNALMPFPGPVLTSPLLPPPIDEVPPGAVPAGELVQVQGARADISPPAGCTAHITFIWELDPSTLPAGRAVAEVVLTGPAKDGPYDVPVREKEVRFEIDVPLSGHDEWTADIAAVDGRPVFPTPLPVSFDNPAC